MPTPLTNDRWGYESNCYVCEPANEGGLRIPFQLEDDHATVTAAFTLDRTYSGAPALVHGGVSLALLDEAQAWACIAVAGKWALTVSTSAAFPEPVFVDHSYRVEAVIERVADGAVHTSGRIVDDAGTACATSTSVFQVVGEVDVDGALNGLSADRQHLIDGV